VGEYRERGRRTGLPGVLCVLMWSTAASASAQDLTPRAYAITPVSSNAIIGTYTFSSGEIIFDPALPIEDAEGTIHAGILTYYAAFGVLGRSANVSASLPYAVGDFRGNVGGNEREAHRAGLMDSLFRFSITLKGGAAVSVAEFIKTRPATTTIGASVRVVAPTGQYLNTRAINPGSNRWAFKPEIGLSRRVGHVLIDVYGGVWLFTANDDYLAASEGDRGRRRTQEPMAAFESHISYDVRPRLWVSFDINYWYGGRTSVDGIESSSSLQANSRFGVTGSLPITRHSSVKFSYSRGAIVRVGGSFDVLSVGWQYGWIGNPFG
jgi:hypothetical protein